MKWFGRCPGCGQWDSLSETGPERASDVVDSTWLGEELRSISEIDLEKVNRLPSGLSELDRLLGGGLIPGGVILFGGEPGIGKSTLLLQMAESIARGAGKILYVSGEESEGQVKLRAARIGANSGRLFVLSEQSLHRIMAAVEQVEPLVLIVDSIQTTADERVAGEAGSVKQLREVSAALIQLTKARGMTTFLVGHITKEGSFAGPKTVEHLVDVAIYLEGSRTEDVRILRSVKNRFGATNEVAVFQMTAKGLVEIEDPSRFFLGDTDRPRQPGSVYVPVLEGTRPILIELQALVSPTGGYGVPQRRCTGLDVNRVLLMLAVMEKHLDVHIGGADVYMSLAGGLDVRERGTDLGVIAAVLSSLRNRALSNRTAVVGEVGLSGEIRPVRRLKERMAEAVHLGIERLIVPKTSRMAKQEGLELVAVEYVHEAIEALNF
ncbi:DNA repair protein RadA [Candidatus Bipolaricaulota bacterium]|nr:DNA repair protein RadA [Candidatus Bipolaricaulota bacterium]